MSLFPLLNETSDLARLLGGGSYLDGELFDPPFYHQRFYIQPLQNQQNQNRQVCPMRGGSASTMCTNEDKFAVRLDARNFAPEELTVKTVDNCLVIHGKHEEKSDDRGCYVSREFTRRYVLPEDVDPQTIKSHLTPGGVLAIEAPRKKKDKHANLTPIKVHHEGKASGDSQKST
ncbi:alpha-crystallin B chain-like [Dermacentor variabilis]|uniref:alpha-crystallin B chain-like n=1 Tax=Dermacentor variabilis TaxID=34621 RepID=UPI003F5C3068